MQPIISVEGLSKTYAGGFQALKGVDLEIRKGEIFALLGPNGAGKTTLISIICGIVNPSTGTVLADGVHVGNFVETKNAQIGAYSKVPHLTYVGDATIGEGSNIGCATVFVNYDGQTKHRTVVGKHTRIGSDTTTASASSSSTEGRASGAAGIPAA